MRELAKSRYSFGHGIAAWINRLLPAWLRWLDECDDHGYHCSQAISKAFRDAGLDLCPDLPDWATFPGDLARSPALRNLERLELD